MTRHTGPYEALVVTRFMEETFDTVRSTNSRQANNGEHALFDNAVRFTKARNIKRQLRSD